MNKRRSILKWDQKKRKYVRQALGQTGIGATDGISDRGHKRVRDESGNLVKEKANLYEVWQKRSKRRIQTPGEAESAEAGEFMQPRKRSKGGRFFHTATKPLPNSNVRSELRSEEQISKMRNEKAKKRDGKGGGKGGGKDSGKGGGKGAGKGGGKGAGKGGGKGAGKGGGKGGKAKGGGKGGGKGIRGKSAGAGKVRTSKGTGKQGKR